MTNLQVTIDKATQLKTVPPTEELGFGRHFTDHMFVIDYTEGQGWHDARIIPYQPLQLDPAAMILHYGQTIFEGLKAYRTKDNDVQLFRPERNFARLNRSAERLCIPAIDEALALEGLKQLLLVDKAWVPSAPGTSLYIRPFIIATEPYLGVSPAASYQFLIIMSPVGSYYKEGVSPVKILVEKEYVRAVAGGTGEAKTAGNYASSLKGAEEAGKLGYSQTLWLDGVERKYIEEVGSMNVFFKIAGTVVTPALNGSILAGITRDSILQLLRHEGVPVEERRISIDELLEAAANGTLQEAWGTGTAAVISPIGQLYYDGQEIVVNGGETGDTTYHLYKTLTGIQYGEIDDPFNWVIKL